MQQMPGKLSSRHFKRMRLLIFFILSLSYMYAPFSRMAPGIMGPELMQSFALDSVQFGLLGLCFMWPYAIGQIPAGLFIDSYGSSKALVVMLLLTAGGNFLFGAAQNFFVLSISRIIIGLSVAGYFLVGTKIISAWYEKDEFTKIYGLFMGLGALGGVISTMPLQIMMEIFGWRNAMLVLGCFSLCLAVLVFLKVSDRPQHYKAVEQTIVPKVPALSISQQLGEVIKIPLIFNCAFICLSISSSGHSLQSLWNGVYLADVYNYGQGTIGAILLCAAIGLVVGGTSTGFFMKYCAKLKIITIGEGIFLLTWLYMVKSAACLSTAELMVINFIFGFMQMLVITTCYTFVKEIAPGNLLATSMGLVNTFIWVLGVGCCQQIWGVIIAFVSDGIKPYGAEAFAAAMWFQFCVLVFGFANACYVYKKAS